MKGARAAREHFAEEIKYRGQISCARLLDALASVPREQFLGKGPWRIRSDLVRNYWVTEDADPTRLYHDVLVAIDESRRLDSGLPSLWAHLLDGLNIKEGECVIQIGCGSGYYSAILSEMVGPAGKVIAIDCEEALVQQARHNLRARRNVKVIHGDGCRVILGPSDVLIIHAGFTHPLPLWLDSLRPGGRLLVPVTNEDWQGSVFRIERTATGYYAEALAQIEIFPCQGRGKGKTDQRLMRFWETMARMRSFALPAPEVSSKRMRGSGSISR
jgi:protein-L-isoaspartate(D-aspartate) O-methyltransferase